MQSIDTRVKPQNNSESLQIRAEADACLRGEISCNELQQRIYPRLRRIESACGQHQPSPKQGETQTSLQPTSEIEGAEKVPTKTGEQDQEYLIQSLRLLVQRLATIADPLREIYVLGAQVFEDFDGVIPSEDYERLSIFRDLAHDQALLVDEDSTLTSRKADDLRLQIRQAAADYLGETCFPNKD